MYIAISKQLNAAPYLHGVHEPFPHPQEETVLTGSLVPRLPCSGMRTLKLCRWGGPGIFSHVITVNGRKALIVRGHTKVS